MLGDLRRKICFLIRRQSATALGAKPEKSMSLLEETRPILRMNGGGCTVHCLYGNSKLRERLLGQCRQEKRARQYRTLFSGSCEKLGWRTKLCTFVTDQGGNIKVAFRDSDFERINCAGHLLNTCLQACFKTKAKSQFPMPAEAVPSLTLRNQLKSLVTHSKQGGISRQLKKTLKQQCDTRWNTHVEMLASVLAACNELELILANRNELQLLPTSRQRIQEIHDLFEPVRDITVRELELPPSSCQRLSQTATKIQPESHGEVLYSTDKPIENEVEKYVRLPSPPEDQDALSFWIEKQKDFPQMSSYALRCLSVPGTSTPSEPLFSRFQ
ncbi:hypothetical protein RvY_03974 [Ramazzottius varieornatus]|uniref:HAT C-terminal dimerisation domain-containing protein n=1 Tax=Ramazzottius varieornatus TaxID=947166 RepID=A0A1D1UQQ6_RAMVA|nr:hypothetical protein RvY_03974 [Ramazzottius varieornatus]